MVAALTVLNNDAATKGSKSFNPHGCNPNGSCGNGLEKVYPTCAVRFGYMNNIGEFRYAPGMLFGCGAKVVIQTERGTEIGQQVSLTCTGCDKSVKRQQMLTYVKNSGQDFFRLKSGRILREANAQDLEEDRRLKSGVREKLQRARELARELGLTMKFVECEHLFGGERIVFYFMSEARVDFRELVRRLAHDYHTRIEMYQVGARDEARLVADYEICGRECCCKSFLKTLRPVSMRMAKLQKATLDPAKVSGRCGRLRCCLRYEHEGYEELNKKLPNNGTRVRTDQGVGTVRDRQILTQLVTIEYDDGGRLETVGIEDLLERDLPQRRPGDAPSPDARQARPADRRPRDRQSGHADRRREPSQENNVNENGPESSGSVPVDDPSSGTGVADSTGVTDGAAGGEVSNQGRPGFGGRRRGRRGRRRRRDGDRGPGPSTGG